MAHRYHLLFMLWLQPLDKDLCGASTRIVILRSACVHVAVGTIKPNCRQVRFIYMQPDLDGTLCVRRAFEPAHQFAARAPAALLRKDLDGLNIGSESADLLAPLHDGKSRQSPTLLSDPGCGVGPVDKLTNVASGKSMWRPETHLLDRIEIVEVLGLEETILHLFNHIQANRLHRKIKEPLSREWLVKFNYL